MTTTKVTMSCIEELREAVDEEARRAIDAWLAIEPFTMVRRRLDQLQRLYEIETTGQPVSKELIAHWTGRLAQEVHALEQWLVERIRQRAPRSAR